MKYIRLRGNPPEFYLFSDYEQHRAVAMKLDPHGRKGVLSAGFVKQSKDGELYCCGRSISLECGARPDDDEHLNSLFISCFD